MNDKETLEEAKIHHVNKWVKGYDHLNLSDFEKNSIAVDFGNGWDKAVKWQQERSYSDEDLRIAFVEGHNSARLRNYKTFFCEGAKWQQERMYSEEEVVNILIKAYEDIGKRKIPNQVVLASWFKQFKKK